MIYTSPTDARCQLQHDSGYTVDGIPDTDIQGRIGQSFKVPEYVPNNWGCRVVLTSPGKVSIMQRGRLVIIDDQTMYLYTDDFIMQTKPPVCAACA